VIEDVLAEVKTLKNDAKLLRDIGEVDPAIAVIDKAIAIVQTAGNAATTPPQSDSLKVELADCWGIKGGILRRSGRLPEALDAYKTGLEFEFGDSYNLTNSLVLELLINPARLRELKTEIEEARAEVERQIQHRSRQWWAWADLGLLAVLAGQEDRALNAYSQFSATGARASDFDTTISVLEELSAKLSGSNRPMAARLERASTYLKRLKP
jgi:tetratricopeptide (TPR) repeat protein